jgi:hypothetical protein
MIGTNILEADLHFGVAEEALAVQRTWNVQLNQGKRSN